LALLPNLPNSPTDERYQRLVELKEQAPRSVWIPVWREMAKRDLWFLVRYVLSTQAIKQIAADHPWAFDRCREVQASPDNHLDVWAREHLKTTIITAGMTILDILNNPNLTFGIFSHTRKLSKKILQNLKVEFEQNQLLKDLFPDIFYANPQKEAIKWSEDDGICVKRTVNRREATVEAHGLVDSMPTGVHFDVMVFDDVVSDTSVSTEDQIRKTTDA
jgi:hypothetical protein